MCTTSNKKALNFEDFDSAGCNCYKSLNSYCSDISCLNISLMTECNQTCRNKINCRNQASSIYDASCGSVYIPGKHDTEIRMTAGGWGLVATAAIPKGKFIIEYTGVMRRCTKLTVFLINTR